MRRVRLTSDADADLAAAIDFYDLQEFGAGDLLFGGVLLELRRLEKLHGFHRKKYGFHKVLVKGFPYAIYYDIFGDELVVMAILDGRRAPSSIQEEMKSRRRDPI